MQGSSSRGGKKVRLIVLHTAEGARNNDDLDAYFVRSQVGSCHAGIDDKGLREGGRFVPYDRAAWTLRSGNPISDNAEMCGFAKWSRAEWLSHPVMLDAAAQWIAKRCKERGIPCVKLSPADVRAGKAGVCGHVDWTQGMKDGSHWDPGPNFPWDIVMTKANDYLGGAAATNASEEDDMTPEQAQQLAELHSLLIVPGQPFTWAQAARDESLAAKESAERIEAALNVPGAPYGWLPALNNKLDALLGLAGTDPAAAVQAATDAKAIVDELTKRLAD